MPNALITCPYCRNKDGKESLMRPQKLDDGKISYVCTNPECRAVSPRADTFRVARLKARKRADVALVWFDRCTDEPLQQGDYLCEYAFFNAHDQHSTPISTFYAVWRWNNYERRFYNETQTPDYYGHYVRVLRWADFTGRATRRGTAAIPEEDLE